MTADTLPPGLSADLRRLAAAELSLPSRLGYVALLLAALTMTAIVGALWLTEPRLPLRTTVAFAVFIAIGLSWAAFAVWVLTHRRVLLAGHRIIAGRLAVLFSAVFVVGALAVSFATGRPQGFLAAGLGLLMTGGALVMLVRAHRAFACLLERRNALGRELGKREA
jgi:hypothetical protein